MTNLVTFDNLFSPIYDILDKTRSRMTTAIAFSPQMILVHARALLSI